MILDNLKFRQLENGYTVKYHCAESGDPESKRFGGEIYVTDVENLKQCVLMLIDKHMQVKT